MFIDYDDFRHDQPHQAPEAWIKVTNPQGRLLVLRPDLTTSVMDKLQWKASDGPLKVCYYASTFERNNDWLKATKEFGFEFFNAPATEGETLMQETLSDLIQAFELRLMFECSHKDVFGILMQILNVPSEDIAQFKSWFNAKSLDAIGDWMTAHGTEESLQDFIQILFTRALSYTDLKQTLNAFKLDKAFASVMAAIEPFTSLSLAPVVVDFTLVSDWTYYSGLIFQAISERLATPLIRGGRYHVASLEGEAIGCSMTLDDLLEVSA
jgi:ATP phosphoribosyltransferase regulatory subunit